MLEKFIKHLLNVKKVVKCTNKRDQFQAELKKKINEIKKCPGILAFADKTSSIYRTNTEDNKKLIKGDITKTYQIAPSKLEKAIILEAKKKKTLAADRLLS